MSELSQDRLEEMILPLSINEKGRVECTEFGEYGIVVLKEVDVVLKELEFVWKKVNVVERGSEIL